VGRPDAPPVSANVNWLRLARDALYLAGIGFAVIFWLYYTTNLGRPDDARWYWGADTSALYPHPELAEKNGYNYSPAFELFIGWSRLLPFEVFVAIYRAILLAAVVYMAGPFTLFVLLSNPVGSEINAGNIQILLALAIAWGFRHPWTWSFVVLTKVTPAVGLLWFVVRREWRKLAIALGASAVLAALSVVFWGDQWPGYIALVTTGKAPAVWPYYLTLYQRLPFSIVLVVIGAWRNWKWTVAAASCLALPVFYPISLSLLVGCLPFIRITLGRLLASRGYSPERRVPNPAVDAETLISPS
jgi:hypothetical protein